MRSLYRLLSALGDLKALFRGPSAYGRRYGRKVVIRSAGRVSRRWFKP